MSQFVYEINYRGKIVPCYIERKRMKSITFRLDSDGEYMKVSCPYLVSEEFLKEKINEVIPKLFKKTEYQKPSDGDSVFLFGKEEVVSGFSMLREEKKKRYYRSLLLSYCRKKVRYYEEMMGIANPYNVAVREMSTRYGVNSRKTHKVTFALSLVHYSPAIIDSVIVHELAHHFVFDHSKSFYDIVYRYYPSYKESHDKLRNHIYQ